MCFFACLAACTPTDVSENISYVTDAQIQSIEALKTQHKASAIGIGIIDDGALVWTGYYGEQSPGIPVSARTMFNTASMSKAVTAETAIRLVDKGLIDLDEPISAYYVHPDIKDDPRHEQLTPRILLTHTSGFMNWPKNYEDGKLAFLRDPGEAYGYSGIGFDIFAMFLEEKLGKPFPEIVSEQVFEPFGMESTSQLYAPWIKPNMVHPVDQSGAFKAPYAFGDEYWNAADDLYVTVEDYAKFIIATMNNEGASDAARELRQTVQTNIESDPVWGCQPDIDPCPSPFGHSVGYFVFGYGDRLNIQHGGNDMSEAATGYFKTDTRDGMIIFVNAPNPEGILLYLKIVELLDEDQDFTKVFNSIVKRYFSEE